MEVEKAIEAIKGLIETFKLQREDRLSNLVYGKISRLIEALETAIQALEKLDYFRNCKDCDCLEYIEDEGEEVAYCNKTIQFGINPEFDGCTFYEDWGDEQ